MNSKAKIIVVLFAFLGFASVSYSQAIITGTRNLPDSYVPGQTITVSLDLSIDETRRPEKWGAILKDFVPAGWTFVSASRAPDVWDPATGELKWVFVHGLLGQEMTDTSMDISYQVTPPSGESEDKTFSGQILYNDPVTSNPITETIGGDTQISGPEPLPTVYFSSTTSNGSEADTDVTLDVELSASSDEIVTVGYAVTGGTAAGEGEDFTLLGSGTLTFAAGDTSENISITINDDSLDEENETIEVTLSEPSNATLGTNTIHTYTIQDDETQPSVEFEVAISENPESVGTAELIVNLLPQSGLEVTVDYEVTDGDATGGGEDYTLLGSGTLTFSAGDTSEKITITIINDLTDENNETIEVTLSNPTNAILGAEKIHTYTILEDNDDIPVISFSSTGSQGDEGVSQVTMAVNLSPASAKTVTVSYTLSGDADAGADYTISPPPLTFTPGETTKDITLTIVDDGFNETNETVTVTLSNPNNALLGANRIYTYTIIDDDIAGIGFALVSSSGSESVTDVTLVVGLSPEAVGEVTVNYSVTGGGTAEGDGVDYTLLGTGVLTFSIGDTSEEISISVVDDSIYEGNETIEVTLSNPTNAELGNNIIHIYTIVDDESLPIVEFDVGTSEGLEDNSPAELIVNISGESTQDVEVNYSVTPGTAKAGQDYTPISNTLTFPAGETDPQTISIEIIDDELDEDDETFTVTLTNPTNADLGTPASHIYTIKDEDDPPSVSFTLPGKESEEGAVSEVTLVVTLSKVSGRTETVNYTVTGTADVGVDFNIAAGPLIFAPGETTKNIILSIVNDDAGEADETVIVELDPTNATLGANPSYTYTIENDDKSSIEFVEASSSAPEADDTVTLAVKLLPAIDQEVTVNYSVTGGTATDGVDYDLLGTGTLTFSPDSTTPDNDIAITIKNDTEVEPDETIIVTLSGPSEDATIGTNESHTYTILNDDDETNPNTYGHIPEPNSIQVARDTIIQLHITDAMIASTSGVDLDTVKIQVEDVVIYNGDVATYDSDLGTCRRVEIIEDEDYTFVFQSSTLFDYEQKVDVVVYAEDKADNPITEDYYFHTVMRSFGQNGKINTDTGTLAQNRPASAMDSEGNIWVVWDETTAAGDTDIYIGKLPADGGTFEESMPVVGGVNNQRNPAIAIDASDVLYVVWEEFADPNWDILLLTSEDGITWTYDSGSEPFKINADLEPEAPDPVTQNPAIAINIITDDMYVTWDEKRDGDKEIWVKKGDIGNSVDWKDTTRVTDDPKDQTEPAVAVDIAGTAYIVWTDARNQDTSTDIYGADSLSGNWENKVVVATSARESSPVIAAESSGTVLHLLWIDSDTDPNASIFYGATTDGLQELLEADIHDVVDEPNYPQSAPAIAVRGSGETTKVFACWQDERNIADSDIYYAESGSDFGTNILVNDDLGTNTQTAPVIGIDKDGNPCIAWVDNRQGNNDIYGARATAIGLPLELDDIEVDANGVTVKAATIANLGVRIPTGALPDGIDADDIKIAEVSNLPEIPSGYGSFGIPFKFGPSGLEFNSPVTIRIPHDPNDSAYPVYNVYRYDPNIPTFWSEDGIHNPATHGPLDVTPHYLEVEVDHFSVFQPGGGAVGAVSGGEDGGGCEISPTGQGNVIEYMLPYVLLTVVWVIIKRKDARDRKTI